MQSQWERLPYAGSRVGTNLGGVLAQQELTATLEGISPKTNGECAGSFSTGTLLASGQHQAPQGTGSIEVIQSTLACSHAVHALPYQTLQVVCDLQRSGSAFRHMVGALSVQLTSIARCTI